MAEELEKIEPKVLTQEAALLAIQTLKDVITALSIAFEQLAEGMESTFRLLDELIPVLKEEPENQ